MVIPNFRLARDQHSNHTSILKIATMVIYSVANIADEVINCTQLFENINSGMVDTTAESNATKKYGAISFTRYLILYPATREEITAVVISESIV